MRQQRVELMGPIVNSQGTQHLAGGGDEGDAGIAEHALSPNLLGATVGVQPLGAGSALFKPPASNALTG